jgi:DNA polymerase-3 subunit delta'
MIFSNLVGQQRAKEMLSRALAHSTVHTGYLFTGPAGVGKHLAAVEFVRAWLCLAASGEACGVCPSCCVGGRRTRT